MNSLTVLEVSDKKVTAVAARVAGHGVEIVHSASADVGAGDDRVASLRSSIEKVGNGDRKVALVIPRVQAILRELDLPDGSQDELVQMVRFQIEKDFPIALDQVYYSFSVTSRSGGKAHVQVAAVPKEILDPIIAAVEASGRKVSAAYVSTFGLMNLAAGGDEAAAVVGAAGGAAEILVVDGGQMTVSRSAPIREGEPLADLLAMEISRTLLAHAARSPGREVGSVLVASEDIGLVAGIGSKVPQKVSALTLNGRFSRKEGITLGLAEAASTGVCLGALVTKAPMPDLLHPPVVVKKFKFGKEYRVGALLVAILALVIGYSRMKLADREKEVAGKKAELDRIKPKAAEVTRMIDNTVRAGEWGAKAYNWLDLFQNMSVAIKNDEIWIQTASFEENGTVHFSGKARSDKAVAAYFEKLVKIKNFRDLKIDNVSPNTEKSEYKNDFQISGKWKWVSPD